VLRLAVHQAAKIAKIAVEAKGKRLQELMDRLTVAAAASGFV
jgi:hypothetical protein